MIGQKKIKINMGSFDLIKGIAIMGVVFTHIIFNYSMEELPLFSPLFVAEKLMSFGLMPMFFIISGYGLKKKDASKMLKQSFSQLIVPYLCASVVSIVLYAIFNCRINSVNDTISEVVKMIKQIFTCDHIAGPLWYFIALFWAENIVNSILHLKNERYQVVAVIASMAIGFALEYFKIFGTTFRLVQGFTAVGFCYFGYILKKKNLIEKLVKCPWVYIVLVPIWLGQVFGVWFLDLRSLNLEMAKGQYSVVTFAMSGCAGLLFVLFGILFDKAKWKCLDLVRSLGAQTYWILIAHTVDFHSIPWYHMRLESRSLYLSFVTDAFLRIVFITIGCSIIKRIMQHMYMKKRMMKSGK